MKLKFTTTNGFNLRIINSLMQSCWYACWYVGFWSHLGCSGQNAIIFSHEGLSQGCTRKNINIYILSVFQHGLFQGLKKLAPLPDRSPLGVEFKISDEHPHPFHMRSPKHTHPPPHPPPYVQFTLGMHSLIEPYARTLKTRLTCSHS